jgi:hypothetical protein
MKRSLTFSTILVFALLAAGCGSVSDDTASPVNTEDIQLQVVDLDSPTGGLTETDEKPLFGEPEAFMAVEQGEGEECEYQDPLLDEEHVREMERRHGVRIYRFRALWGKMADAVDDLAVADCCGVDWSGGMKLEGGVIVIERVIRFEPNDEINRTGPNTIRWKSKTCSHVDGIQVRLIVPPAAARDSTVVVEAATDAVRPEPKLTIVAGPYERTFTLDELAAMRVIQPVDRCNDYMAVASHRILPGCPSGYLLGSWNRASQPDTLYNEETGKIRGVVLGHFKGIWVSERGWAVGHVRGFYGVNSNLERKFFGKYINPKGEFMGIIAGDWDVYPTLAASPAGEMGSFEGLWYGRNHGIKGRLKGDWVTSAGQGYFKGIWDMLCNERM